MTPAQRYAYDHPTLRPEALTREHYTDGLFTPGEGPRYRSGLAVNK